MSDGNDKNAEAGRDARDPRSGICHLVGAGPGDPGLLTLRGRECLRHADVIVHDHLAAEALLALAPADALRIYVGKEAGNHTMSQDDINAVLVEHTKAGKVVVRLKGGDPLVFGRGGEEALALMAAGLRYTIVPGITSGIATPAYAGVPVTHRAISEGVTLITGHRAEGIVGANWQQLAALGHTLCIYMGTRNLPTITQGLLAGGRDPATPVAVIEWGTTAKQRSVKGTLANICTTVQTAGLGAPAIVVIGEVAGEVCHLPWRNGSLAGRRVLVTRTSEQSQGLIEGLIAQGAEPVLMPCIEISALPMVSGDAAQHALSQLGSFSWTIFTSVNAVEHAWNRLRHIGKDTRIFAQCRIAAMGQATAKALEARGLIADCIPAQFTSAALAKDLGTQVKKDEKILIFGPKEPRPELTIALGKLGAQVTQAPVYQTTEPSGKTEEPGHLDAITLCSPSAVKGLLRRLPNIVQQCQEEHRPKIISIGPVTSAAIRNAGLPVDAEASPSDEGGLMTILSSVF